MTSLLLWKEHKPKHCHFLQKSTSEKNILCLWSTYPRKFGLVPHASKSNPIVQVVWVFSQIKFGQANWLFSKLQSQIFSPICNPFYSLCTHVWKREPVIYSPGIHHRPTISAAPGLQRTKCTSTIHDLSASPSDSFCF